MLIEAGAHVDQKDAFGLTALAAAAAGGEYSVVEILLEAGAAPNVQNKYGQSPLMLAAKSGLLDVVQLLLDSGADATTLDYTGRGALSWSDEGRNRTVRRVLEKAGARE
ncbi:MAG: ankyrin repeat domain-containing protein [Rhodospirillaceae bacterium]|nr:ankyrin repeat domain-containing protein [Rhodospirillaceae bacterium]